jgi:hypothetical protein
VPDITIINPNSDSGIITLHVGLDSIVPLGEYGDHKYVFSIATLYKDKEGNSIKPIYIHTVAISGFWEALPNAIESICDQIDWGDINVDRTKPYVSYYGPSGDNTSLFSSVVVRLKDDYPSAGIDTSSIKMYINDIEVTTDLIIDGSYKDIKLVWNPNKRVVK